MPSESDVPNLPLIQTRILTCIVSERSDLLRAIAVCENILRVALAHPTSRNDVQI